MVLVAFAFTGEGGASFAADMPLLRDDSYSQTVDVYDLSSSIGSSWSWVTLADDQDFDHVDEDSLAVLNGALSQCSYGSNNAEISCQGVAECKTPPNVAFLAGECISLIGGLLQANSVSGYFSTVGCDAESNAKGDFIVQEGPEEEQYGTMTIEFDLDCMGSIPLYAGTIYVEVSSFDGTNYNPVAFVTATAAGGLWHIQGSGPDFYVDEYEYSTPWTRTYTMDTQVEAGDRFRVRSRSYEHIEDFDYVNTSIDYDSVSHSHDLSAVASISVQSN